MRAVTGLGLRDVSAMVVAGIVIGAVVALMLSDLARSLLFGLTPTEPIAFVIAASILAVTALVVGWLPARRASRVDPLIALRHESRRYGSQRRWRGIVMAFGSMPRLTSEPAHPDVANGVGDERSAISPDELALVVRRERAGDDPARVGGV